LGRGKKKDGKSGLLSGGSFCRKETCVRPRDNGAYFQKGNIVQRTGQGCRESKREERHRGEKGGRKWGKKKRMRGYRRRLSLITY